MEEEAKRIEHEFEEYGGDDPHDPPPRSPQSLSSKLSAVPEQQDLNMVTWDGPDDPKNPQNWSEGYKWLITAVAIIMTVNVYVCCP